MYVLFFFFFDSCIYLFFLVVYFFFFFKKKTAYEMRISDWSSDVCSSDLIETMFTGAGIDDDFEPVAQIIRQWLVKIDDPLVAARRHDVDHGDIEAEPVQNRQGIIQRIRRALQAMPAPDLRRIGTLWQALHDLRAANLLQRGRSEEHTSELQSLMRHSYAVFCLTKTTASSK